MKKKSLEERVQRLEDVRRIENLMGIYERQHTAGLHAENVAQHWAKKTPGVKTEISHVGVWEGVEGIKRFWINCQNSVWDRLGHMHLHTLTTPVIEVAGDGKTAQGVWISPGVETGPTGKPLWAWVKYGIDFVKEVGEWKFWHFRLYRFFMTPYDKSWAESALATGGTRQWPPDKAPDGPPTYTWVYGPDVEPDFVPKPPEPYETWDDAMSYVK